MNFIKNFFSMLEPEEKTPIISVDDMQPANFNGQKYYSPWDTSIWDGSKFAGDFGTTQIQTPDYWTLRARSVQLFTENLYARGLIRRLVTNEINTGLTPEAAPDEQILGLKEDSLTDWTEEVENRFGIWAKSPKHCDWAGIDTFGAIQRAARMESLISGDVLCVLRQSSVTKLPKVQLISGGAIQTPLAGQLSVRPGHTIVHGVEKDTNNKVVAYWVLQDDGKSKRLPAFGEKSGRRIAWLVFGTEKRLDETRGQPILSLVLQSLKEIDRYRDSTQRKATINSFLAMFIQKDTDKMGTLPMTGGAIRKNSQTVTDSDSSTRTYSATKHIPGLVMEELQTGEKPVGFESKGTDLAFGDFEEAIIQAVAWANEIPPEILRLAFSNNYSASQAAINEFKIYLNLVWSKWGETFCTPVYVEWLLAEVLQGRVSAPGLLDAWRNPLAYDKFGAWVATDWYGSIKPSTDMLKQAKGSKLLVDEGWSTNAREARITTGTKFSKNIKRLKRENELKVQAMTPIAEFKAKYGETVQEGESETISEIRAQIEAIENGETV